MELQLYMWPGTRALLIERHDFYVSQIKARVFSQFRDIEDDAKRYADAEYERIGSLACGEDADPGAIAEHVQDRAVNYYLLLDDLKKQITLGALAGMYHQWDKDLRDFVERELAHDIKREAATKFAWFSDVGKIFTSLEKFGWDCRKAEWFPLIDACRLVVNVHKHGKGPSLRDLAKRYPEYLSDPLASAGFPWPSNEIDSHEFLGIDDTQFEAIAGALRRFWTEFPERLFLTISPHPSP